MGQLLQKDTFVGNLVIGGELPKKILTFTLKLSEMKQKQMCAVFETGKI